MEFWTVIAVCMAASLGAGFGTGLAGMSAAAVISPMLSTFLGVPPYQAIGIALASDVLASALSAVVYARHRRIDLRGGTLLMASVLLFTYLGSLLSSRASEEQLGVFSIVMTFIVGLQFVINPNPPRQKGTLAPPLRVRRGDDPARMVKTLLSGALIGMICGYIGAGGGMMMLIVLTAVLGYGLKTAVGTSVFVMTFTALTGAATHFVVGGIFDWKILALCCVATCLFAQIASTLANVSSERLQKRVTGVVLVLLSAGMMAFKFL